jgi:hypothetical protein
LPQLGIRPATDSIGLDTAAAKAVRRKENMATRPNPARLPEYQAKLGELMAAREEFRALRNDQAVRVVNRQIRAQLKWIKKARELETAPLS